MPRHRLKNPLRDLPREVGVLVAVAFSVAIGFGMVGPAISTFARSFGVSRAAAAAVISAFALARLVAALPGGRLVDRFGERRVMATGIAIVAVSSALAGLSQGYGQLLLLRATGGVGSAMFTVSALSLLLRSVRPDQRGQASGLFTGGFLLGGIAGPTIGGFVAEISIRLPFFLYAGTLAVAGTVAFTMLREPDGAAVTRVAGSERMRLGAALRLRAFRAAMTTNFADQWAVLGLRVSLLPLFVRETLHRGLLWTGLGLGIVTAVNAAVLLPAGRLADRIGRKPVMLSGCLIGGASMALLAFTHSLTAFLLVMVVLGLGSGLLDVSPSAVVGDVVGAGGGTTVAAYQMAGDTGVIAGPVICGFLADTASYAAAFGTTAGVFGVAALLVAVMPETLKSGQGSGEVGDQIVNVLDADGQTNQIVGDLEV
ncbi:MAG: MFS transporter [Actinomycetes bacterium]